MKLRIEGHIDEYRRNRNVIPFCLIPFMVDPINLSLVNEHRRTFGIVQRSCTAVAVKEHLATKVGRLNGLHSN